MLRGKAAFEWQVLEDESGANRPAASRQTLPPPRQRRWNRFARVTLAMLAFLFLSDLAYAVQEAEQQFARIEAEIGLAAATESWAVAQQDAAAFTSLLDGDAPLVWRQATLREMLSASDGAASAHDSARRAELLELDGDYALVIVRDTAAGTAETPGEVRFYRENEGNWLRTAPQEVFWGDLQRREYPHFVFEFRARDAEAVETAAADLESLYVELHEVLGAQIDPDADRLLISVAPALLPRHEVFNDRFTGNRLEIDSPPLSPDVAVEDAAAAIYRNVAGPLAQHALEGALTQLRIVCTWQPVADGVGLWMREQYSSQRSQQWREFEELLRVRWAQGPPRLVRLNAAAARCAWYSYVDPYPDAETRQQLIAARTMTEYAVAAYGESSIELLLEAFRRHYTWNSLVPAVFGVSAREFEQGWQEYVDAHYGVNRSPTTILKEAAELPGS